MEKRTRKNKPGGGRPISAPPPWGELAKRLGGNEKLAETLGVSRSSVNKWTNGVHRIPELVKKEIVRLCQQFQIEEGLDQFIDSSKTDRHH